MSVEEQIADYRIHFGGEMSEEKAAEVVSIWCSAVQGHVGGEQVLVAAPFQRHFRARDTGLPTNFCLAITPTLVLAFKFNARNRRHPLSVNESQIKQQEAEWARKSFRVVSADAAGMSASVTFEADSDTGLVTIPCRTPRFAVNPAASVAVRELGGSLAGS